MKIVTLFQLTSNWTNQAGRIKCKKIVMFFVF
jgi:hypothetical protein